MNKTITQTEYNTYERFHFGPYTIEVVTEAGNKHKKQIQILIRELTKGNGGYHYISDFNIPKNVTRRWIAECESKGLIVTEKYIRLKEGRTFSDKLENMVIDSYKRRLPETIDFK